MKDKVEHFLSFCSDIDFGTVTISSDEKEFCQNLDNEINSLCNSLPESSQEDALLFIRQHFQIPFGQEPSFFMCYYVPAWSIIYWLIQSAPKGNILENEDIHNSKSAHSMALLLHPIDDHLNDGQIPATHLTILLRSQAWMIMKNAFNRLACGIDDRKKFFQGFLDDYYCSIKSSKEIFSLNSYCNHFRKQMATWLIIPIFLARKLFKDKIFADAIQTAYESFGIAWRLLDDINDIQIDMIKGSKSAIYVSLAEDIRKSWVKVAEDKNTDDTRVIFDYIFENSIIEKVINKIIYELELAASVADNVNLTGWADEIRCLLVPFRNSMEWV